jgi:hypothetical protein
MNKPLLLAALASLVLVAGCGTDDTSDDSDAGTDASDDTTTDGSASDAASDAATPDADADDTVEPPDATDTTHDAQSDIGEDTTDATVDPDAGGDAADANADAGNSCTPGALEPCNDGSYCATPEGECLAASGACTPTPAGCPDVIMPVCGCDGATYSNSCEAAAAGVSVDYAEACAAPTTCTTNAECTASQFCNSSLLDCNAVGTCEEKPLFCPFTFLPVCGCDGTTYDNACIANSSGVRVASEGECSGAATCTKSSDCSESEYCVLDPGTCGAAEGLCAERPLACGEIFAPVCGCDDMTYSNACEAAAAGADIASSGACPL